MIPEHVKQMLVWSLNENGTVDVDMFFTILKNEGIEPTSLKPSELDTLIKQVTILDRLNRLSFQRDQARRRIGDLKELAERKCRCGGTGHTNRVRAYF